jgi:UDP-N-acetylglucosamine acyltransferase
MHEAGHTSIGNANFLMATSHVGHDCTIGNRIVIANAVLVAGHVDIADHCFLGGGSAFHQFIRIGTYAMVQGNGSFSCDIPPFCTAFRENAVAGLNVVGLRRGGFDSAARADIKRAYSTVFHSPAGPVKAATAALEETSWSQPARHFLSFIAHPGSKGVARPRE